MKIPERVRGFEIDELRGHMYSERVLQEIVNEIESSIVVQSNRPLILIPSYYRFLSRTLHIVKHLLPYYRFRMTRALQPSEEKPACCWALYPFASDGGYTRQVWAQYGIPYVLTMRGQIWNMGQEYINAAYPVYKDAACIVSLTNSMIDEVLLHWRNLDSKKFIKIPNGAYTGPENDTACTRVIPSHLPKPIILCHTNLSFKEKRRAVDELVREVEASKFNGSFVVTGKGAEHAPQQQRMGTKSHYLGFIGDRFQVFKEADVLLYHSYLDGQPSTIMEAMSLGVPVVVSDQPKSGASEFVKHNETGCIFKTPQRGVDMVLALLDNPASLRKLGAAARKDMEENYTWEQAAMAYDEVFKGVING